MRIFAFAAAASFLPRQLPSSSPARCRSTNRKRPTTCLTPPASSVPSDASAANNKFRPPRGQVFLVGTGPGDPGLLTLKAVHLLRTAQVVLYDRLVSDDILSFINPSAEKVCVGKGRNLGTGSQRSIQEQIAYHASLGKRVVRLKGGDPAIFGRLGDELSYLRGEKGIEAGVVPGLTAASGAAASLGFPLTHGGVSEELRLITGHSGRDKQFEIAQVTEGSTLVVYMGLREMGATLETLQKRGARKDLPAVAVQGATTAAQRVVWGRVENLAARVEQVGLKSPTVVIIGEVVRMAHEWEETAK